MTRTIQRSESSESSQIKKQKDVFLIFALTALFALPALSLSSTLAAVAVVSPLAAARVYPNPWRADLHENAMITFENLPADSTIKIFTVSAHKIRTLAADSTGTAKWDRLNASGDPVASGIYLYLISDSQGHETQGKLAIIK